MTQIEELDGELDSIEPEVDAFSNADVVVPEAYLRPMAALGYYGPVGPYGPLGQWGPVGEDLFNPSQFLDLLGPWGDWAKILTDVGGPLSQDGPLGHRGPVAREYWRGLLDSSAFIRQEFVDHLEPGGLLSVSGPIGPLGALGPLGPLGPVGAHGYSANDDGQWIPEDGECVHSDEKDVCRTVVVSFDGEESREYELFENYDEDFAQRMEDNDTSFMVEGTIPSPDEEVDVYEFTSNETQMVTLLVFGQETRNHITSSAVPLIMQAGAAAALSHPAVRLLRPLRPRQQLRRLRHPSHHRRRRRGPTGQLHLRGDERLDLRARAGGGAAHRRGAPGLDVAHLAARRGPELPAVRRRWHPALGVVQDQGRPPSGPGRRGLILSCRWTQRLPAFPGASSLRSAHARARHRCWGHGMLHRRTPAGQGRRHQCAGRGPRGDRLEREGLTLRDAITEQTRTVQLPIVRAPVTETFDFVMVFVQALHRDSVVPQIEALPGRPAVWFLGNTGGGFEELAARLGRDRLLGGFPGVGGTWDGDTLVYADRQKPKQDPFDSLIIGEAFSEGEATAVAIRDHLEAAGLNMEHHVPIMAWHLSHLALVVPLAGAYYARKGDLASIVADRELLGSIMRATVQGLEAVRKAGYPILPRRLRIFRFMPTGIGARKIGSLLDTRFGHVALAAHAEAARDEMHQLATDLLALAGPDAGPDLRALLEPI